MSDFNPNNVGVANGSYFALPYSFSESKTILISVPWDVTVSYGKGAAEGPAAIMESSTQVDLFDERISDCWETKIATVKTEDTIAELNKSTGAIASNIIEALEAGASEESQSALLSVVNEESVRLNSYVYAMSDELMKQGKLVGLVGGDHSTPLGSIKAVGENVGDFGILHLDAHADLRNAYEGFTYSHASIMYNTLKEVPQLSSLVQVGIRDYCEDEMNIIKTDERITLFSDFEMKKALYKGENWDKICDNIIAALPSKVYVSFDIDVLSPENCPGTGTPVPGGLSYSQVDYLLYKLYESGKQIVGFDLVEVSPTLGGEINGNIGARILYRLAVFATRSNKF